MKRLLFVLILLAMISAMAGSTIAITATTCVQSAHMSIKYYSTPTTFTRPYCVKNENLIPVNVTLTPSSNLNGLISLSQTTVALAAGETKNITLTATIGQLTTVQGTIEIFYSTNPSLDNVPTASASPSTITISRGDCQEGNTQACQDYFGCTGSQTCRSSYTWGDCEVTDPRCSSGGNTTCQWDCTDWSTCANNRQTRTCSNPDGCTTPSPITFQPCGNCVENWQYGPWSECVNDIQTRTATDLNECGTTENRSIISRVCGSCTPSWTCTWSSCQPSNTKTGSNCRDINQCGLPCTVENDCITTKSCTYTKPSGGGGGGGGGSVSATISETQYLTSLEGGKEGSFVFQKYKDLYIEKVDVTLSDTNEGPQLTIREAKLPSGAPAPAENKTDVIDYLQITRTNIPSDSIAGVTFHFRISKAQIAKANATLDDIQMARYLETQKTWQYLSTRLETEDTTYAYYTADSEGFSTFAIIVKEGASTPAQAAEPDDAGEGELNATAAPGQQAGAADASANEQGGAQEVSPEDQEQNQATGMMIADLPKSPIFIGVILFLVVIVIIIVVVKTSGRSSIEMR